MSSPPRQRAGLPQGPKSPNLSRSARAKVRLWRAPEKGLFRRRRTESHPEADGRMVSASVPHDSRIMSTSKDRPPPYTHLMTGLRSEPPTSRTHAESEMARTYAQHNVPASQVESETMTPHIGLEMTRAHFNPQMARNYAESYVPFTRAGPHMTRTYNAESQISRTQAEPQVAQGFSDPRVEWTQVQPQMPTIQAGYLLEGSREQMQHTELENRRYCPEPIPLTHRSRFPNEYGYGLGRPPLSFSERSMSPRLGETVAKRPLAYDGYHSLNANEMAGNIPGGRVQGPHTEQYSGAPNMGYETNGSKRQMTTHGFEQRKRSRLDETWQPEATQNYHRAYSDIEVGSGIHATAISRDIYATASKRECDDQQNRIVYQEDSEPQRFSPAVANTAGNRNQGTDWTQICGIRYQSKKKRTAAKSRPLQASSSTSRFSCEQCKRKFLSLEVLDTHKRGMHTHSNRPECGICGEICEDWQQLSYHVWEEHEKNQSPWQMGAFSCSSCQIGFGAKEELDKHMKKVHNTEKEVEEEAPIYFDCEFCRKKFIRKEKYEWHKKNCEMAPAHEE